MLEVLREHLKGEGVFSQDLSPHMLRLTECVTGDVTLKMKLSIAVSEMMLFSSQFRRYIKLPADKTPIPVNFISMLLAESGANKDRTVKSIRAALFRGYKVIESQRLILAKQLAIEKATNENRENPEAFEVYKEFYKKPAALFAAMTNSAAYLDHLADMEELPLGAGYLYTGELGSEMETNPDMVPSVRVMSEIYDVGYKEAKPLKSKESQTPEIQNLAVSALLIGSHENILFEEKIKNIFKKEYNTKLARRTFFTFTPEKVNPPVFTGTNQEIIKKMLKFERDREDKAILARDEINEQAAKIAVFNIKNSHDLTLDDDARDIYDIYMRYNNELAQTIPKIHPISVLVRKHCQWKALKLAGAIAIYSCRESITKQDLVHAISYVEMISGDMALFENELVKEKYESFCDHMQFRAEEGSHIISLHTLKKMQYIVGTGAPQTKMKELCEMSNSYDQEGSYVVADGAISYTKIEKTDVTGGSFLAIDNSGVTAAIARGASKEEITEEKSKVAATTASGFTFAETKFDGLDALLSRDLAFTPFKLKNGVRGKENIISGTTWICFDIDDSKITKDEMHFILSDVNHHIACTSDPDNHYKFRLMVQLDAPADLGHLPWKHFINSVGEFLGLTIDRLPQSQIFFGYEGRKVLSVTDQSPVEIKDHITYALSKATDTTPEKELTTKEKDALLSNKYTTLEFAFEARDGSGSRLLYAAAVKLFKLGAPKEDIINTMHEISDYWDSPFPAHRLDALARQIKDF